MSSVFGAARNVVPKMSMSSHKGQAGRVGVVGGSEEYTGAPFYAAMAALRGGADLAFVFCLDLAAGPIKTYSPELIVIPRWTIATEELSRLSAICVGPGLGRSSGAMEATRKVVEQSREASLPIVLDGDALWWLNDNVSVLKAHPRAVITPNAVEFDRLYRAAFAKPPPALSVDLNASDPRGVELPLEHPDVQPVAQLSKWLGGVTVIRKGRVDVISNGERAVACGAFGSPRRCGGQGDVLAGLTALFMGWAAKANASHVAAAYGACLLTRRANSLAFRAEGRSMTTPDMLRGNLGLAFKELFDNDDGECVL